jgi:uncharacterized hydrophobic protein (TIGR00271 family)
MRQIIVQVSQGHGELALAIARRYGGINLACWAGVDGQEALDMVLIHVSNGQVEGLLTELEKLPRTKFTLLPVGVIPLRPPTSQAPEQVTDVALRSPIEVFLGGLQSVGSWIGFLGYAAAAGVVVWIGLFTNSSYLLVAAMLIAPFAGPAMNTALATARGDFQLLWRSLRRYFAALAVCILMTALLSFVLQQEVVTSLMDATSQISSIAVLLPLVAGAAGALNLVQSERSSLVSGAATGMLVAASLAPPAGLVGMAGVMERWDMVANGLFLLVLQLVGINLAGALVFRGFGLTSSGARYERGRPGIFLGSVGIAAVILAGLLVWQFWDEPNLQRTSLAQRAIAEIRQTVERSGLAWPLEVDARFTSSSPDAEQKTLLTVVYAQRRAADPALTDTEIRQQLTKAIEKALQEYKFMPLVQINLLEKSL